MFWKAVIILGDFTIPFVTTDTIEDFTGFSARTSRSTMEIDDLEQNLLNAFSSMNTNDRDDLIRQFQSLTGQNISRGTCEFFLDMNSW